MANERLPERSVFIAMTDGPDWRRDAANHEREAAEAVYFQSNDEVGGRNDEEMPRMANERLLERSVPDRSPGHAFIAIAHPVCRRHAKI